MQRERISEMKLKNWKTSGMQIMLEETFPNSLQVRDNHNKSVFISANLDNCLILWWDERHKELQAKHDIAILELQDQLEVANDHETTLSK